eukprot:scaffold339_cov402-Prasinococcus_capsulatus_cf.AAC.8
MTDGRHDMRPPSSPTGNRVSPPMSTEFLPFHSLSKHARTQTLPAVCPGVCRKVKDDVAVGHARLTPQPILVVLVHNPEQHALLSQRTTRQCVPAAVRPIYWHHVRQVRRVLRIDSFGRPLKCPWDCHTDYIEWGTAPGVVEVPVGYYI